MSSDAAVQIDRVGKRYGRNWALRDCTLSLPAGRVIALVGANGAGKTTLLHLAIGLMRPTEGTVSLLGTPLRPGRPQTLSQVGFVPQDHPLYRGFTVAEMLRYGRKTNARFDQAGAERRLQDLGIPLESRTWPGIAQEIYALLTVYQVIRIAIADTAQASGADPDRCSFSIALNTARDQVVQAQGVIADTVIDLIGAIGRAVLSALMPARRNRLSPRAVKRPLSRYAYKSIKVDRHTYKATISIDILTSTPGP